MLTLMLALVMQSLRGTATQWPRMLVAAALVLFPVVDQALSASSEIVEPEVTYICAVLAAGCCSLDAASGFMRVVLSRPVRRFDYLLARAVAGFLATTCACAVQALLSWGTALAFGCDEPPHPWSVARAILMGAAAGVLLVPYFVAASSVLPGVADFALLGICTVVVKASAELIVVRTVLVDTLLAVPAGFMAASPLHACRGGTAIVLLSHVALWLGIGAVLFNRRQVPDEARS